MTYKCVLATVCIPFFSFCLTLIFSTIQLHSLVKTSDSREIVLACQEEKIFWPGVLYVTQDRKKKKQEERNPIALCKSLNCSSAGRRRVFPLFFFFLLIFCFLLNQARKSLLLYSISVQSKQTVFCLGYTSLRYFVSFSTYCQTFNLHSKPCEYYRCHRQRCIPYIYIRTDATLICPHFYSSPFSLVCYISFFLD